MRRSFLPRSFTDLRPIKRLEYFRSMKSRNMAFAAVANGLDGESIFSRTRLVPPPELQIYFSSSSFEWHRTWSAPLADMDSPRTHLIKGRHYANFRKAEERACSQGEICSFRDRQRGVVDSLFLFLVSFATSSLLVFVLALFQVVL